jgi:hypothetical protein
MFDKYAKAIVSGLSAGVIMYFTLRTNGVTADEWATIVTSIVVGSGLTWAVPNAAPDAAVINKYTSVSTSHPVESIQMTTKTDGAK